MQWFKSAMVISSAVFVAAMAANGCSSNNNGGDDAGKDTGVTGKDSGGTKDSGGGDSAGGCQSGLACETCDVTGYTAPSMGKPLQMLGACQPSDITAFVAACFSSNATQATCTAWANSQPDGGSCLTCTSPVLQSDAAWGPFDCPTANSSCPANSGGCIDLVLAQTAQEKGAGGSGSCGDLITTNFGCQDYACDTCADTDFQTCDTSATQNECATYVNAVDSASQCAAINGDAAPPAAQDCFPQGDDTSNAAFINIFCGTGPG